jgi:hypothetical protein
MRALITAVIVLVSSAAEAQWHAAVAPPRPTLPTVTVDFGYPARNAGVTPAGMAASRRPPGAETAPGQPAGTPALPYIPWDSSPITLHATAGDAPFDGYIGYNFRLNERVSYDTHVVARAVLRPHEQWTFSTFARLRSPHGATNEVPSPRALFVEWRDAAMHDVAARDAGTPPWTMWNAQTRALRVTHAGESAPASVLGRAAYAANANQLSDRAQWYAGFAAAAVPLDVWLDLPRRVREAIVGSGIELALFGLPRSGQQLDDLDRALLPVTFGSIVMPKPETDAIGSDTVRSAAATWCASDAGVAAALPVTRATSVGEQAGYEISFAHDKAKVWPRPAQLLRRYAGIVTSLAAVVIALAGWILLRRRQRAGIAVAMLGFAVLAFGVRARIRPAAGSYVFSVQAPAAPGIADTLEVRRSWGPSPLGEPFDAARMRTSITGADDRDQWLEVRTTDTPLAMGAYTLNEWNAITRWTRRRELTAAGARIQIRSHDSQKLVLDFESPFAVNRVVARWLCGDYLCFGETAIGRSARGTVTVESRHHLWNEVEPFLVDISVPRLTKSGGFRETDVVLIDRSASGNRQIEWLGPRVERPMTFAIKCRPSLEADGSTSWTFALPAGSHAAADALLAADLSMPELTLTSASGTVTLRRAANGAYPIPSNHLGGVIKLSANRRTHSDALIQVRETKP